ncbi:LytS family sensor histidine kinase [Sphingobacterium hungaricum]|uniref:Histidine kinase n=1 Tax=Sphingobacterium hungaricum TaxID=2082723 RepID=A0A928V2C3_9SPHI|nr:histidine kinase [Sphingobacterium hungaricum]MBE8714859.1 histidine kinase [Sphingobacterium hungaricum]
MSSFLDRIFGSKLEVDLAKIESDALLSFQQCQFDSNLIQLFFSVERKEANTQQYLEFQKSIAFLKENEPIDIRQEIEILKNYILLYQGLQEIDFYIQYKEKLEDSAVKLPPLTLLPIIQNAIIHGYSSMEKYPIKVSLLVYANAVQLEVSNRVNHYLESQENTVIISRYKNRLVQHFPDRFSLLFNSNSNTFKGTLNLRF